MSRVIRKRAALAVPAKRDLALADAVRGIIMELPSPAD
jgi:hypothetical protein